MHPTVHRHGSQSERSCLSEVEWGGGERFVATDRTPTSTKAPLVPPSTHTAVEASWLFAGILQQRLHGGGPFRNPSLEPLRALGVKVAYSGVMFLFSPPFFCTLGYLQLCLSVYFLNEK